MKHHEKNMQVSFADSVLIMLAIVTIIVVCVRLKLSLVIPLLLCWIAIFAYSVIRKLDWVQIQKYAVGAISDGFVSVLITVSVGALIGTWILSATVPTIIYYGLTIISPQVFLPATLILCSMLSMATGTSYGSAGSAGLAMMGIGLSMGFPAGLVAGAVICGALFGDKMSPFSDTTNLCPAMAGGELFKHIGSMMWNTVPAWLICLVLFYILGANYSASNYDPKAVAEYMAGLQKIFDIGPVALLPIVLVIVLLVFKTPALPTILIGALSGGILAMVTQGAGIKEVVTAMHKGFSIDSDIYLIKRLLNRGGVNSMMDVAYIMIFGMGLGGMLERMGILGNFLNLIIKQTTTFPRLIWATMGVSYLSGAVGCTQSMAQVITGKLLAPLYREKGVAPEMLSRTMEDTSTMGGSLIPWHTNAMFFSAALSVTYWDYLPYVFLCYLCPVITLVLSYTGISIRYIDPVTGEPIDKEKAPISQPGGGLQAAD